MDNFLVKLFLIIIGLMVIRFGVIQFKKYRDTGMKTKNNLFDKVIFLLFFALTDFVAFNYFRSWALVEHYERAMSGSRGSYLFGLSVLRQHQ